MNHPPTYTYFGCVALSMASIILVFDWQWFSVVLWIGGVGCALIIVSFVMQLVLMVMEWKEFRKARWTL